MARLVLHGQVDLGEAIAEKGERIVKEFTKKVGHRMQKIFSLFKSPSIEQCTIQC